MPDVRATLALALALCLAPAGAAAQGPIGAERVFGRSPPQRLCFGRPCPGSLRRGPHRDLIGWAQIRMEGWAPPATPDRSARERPATDVEEPGEVEEPAPHPSPGALHLAYLGALDSEGALHGLTVRGALHLYDVLALELAAGVLAGRLQDHRTRVELPLTVGLRVQAPLRRRIARLYGVVGTGLLLRTTPDRADHDPVAIWPLQVGAGLELGFPVGGVSLGVVFDVRLDVRVPVADGDASVGPAWSAGLSLSWY
jgi:hypothetical protein